MGPLFSAFPALWKSWAGRRGQGVAVRASRSGPGGPEGAPGNRHAPGPLRRRKFSRKAARSRAWRNFLGSGAGLTSPLPSPLPSREFRDSVRSVPAVLKASPEMALGSGGDSSLPPGGMIWDISPPLFTATHFRMRLPGSIVKPPCAIILPVFLQIARGVLSIPRASEYRGCSFPPAGCRSSVVERILGKAEVASSILADSTSGGGGDFRPGGARKLDASREGG